MPDDNVFELNAWKGQLQQSAKGPRKTMTNLMIYLRNIPDFRDTIRWNEMAQRAEWGGDPIDDSSLVDIRLILEKNGFEPTVGDVMPAVIRHAKDNAYHPIRDYLQGLEWDGEKRIGKWLTTYMGAPDSHFVSKAGKKTLIAAVARAMQPGCKVDTVLVLEGQQGIRKSTAIAKLFGEDYTAESVNLFDQHNKMVMAMMGAWVVELAEFVAIQRSHKNTVKGMLSMKSDRVVLPYAKMATDHPRQCIFFGTINPGETGYLTDGTGNRRYWPVPVMHADIEGIERDRDQLWAEAFSEYQWDEPWWFTDDEDHFVTEETGQREEYDIWDEVLEERIRRKEAELNGPIGDLTLAYALELIGVPTDRMGNRERDRAAASLRRLGFTSVPRSIRNEETGKRQSVRVYRRSDE